jgi:bifunctional DNA-binding transcriptional regulator/antitoxin component of YhaV-PrlF toxin-antitoxin module
VKGKNISALTIQIQQEGTLSLPSELRAKLKLNEGDTLTIFDLDGIFLLMPRSSVVSELAGKIEQLRQKEGLSIEDLINNENATTRKNMALNTTMSSKKIHKAKNSLLTAERAKIAENKQRVFITLFFLCVPSLRTLRFTIRTIYLFKLKVSCEGMTLRTPR